MFIDAGKGKEVPWTKPDQFSIDPADPLSALGEEPEGGYLAVFRDGSVHMLNSAAIKEHYAGRETPVEPDETDSPDDVRPPSDDAPDPDSVDAAADAVREWTDSTGKLKVMASLVKVEGDKVTLRRADNGKEVTLPIEKLSDADQEYLKEAAVE